MSQGLDSILALAALWLVALGVYLRYNAGGQGAVKTLRQRTWPRQSSVGSADSCKVPEASQERTIHILWVSSWGVTGRPTESVNLQIMGDHYIPQFYLKGFCEPTTPEIIARYEKGSRETLVTQVKNVAQETGFYSREVEQFLANEVESPANRVLQLIRERRPITPDAKFTLAVYMVTMLKRVPQGQVRIQEYAPEVIPSLFGRLDQELVQLADIYPEKAEVIEKRRDDARRLRVQYEAEVPKEIWLELISPHTTPQTLAALSAMTWRFLTSDKGSAFLTSDNPVYYHSAIGIGHSDSEVSFPISSNVVLWATWRHNLQEGFFPMKEGLVREMNRRTASTATRYVFYSRREEWVVSLINRKRHRLNRIN